MTKSSSMMALLAALIGTGVLVSGATEAHEAGKRGERGAPIDFSTLDADGDGTLTLAEIQARATERFAEADTDGDGVLSESELLAAAEARSAATRADRIARLIENRDDNSDGVLSAEELMPRNSRAERMFERLDADNDGVVTEEEFAELGERMRGRGEGRGHHQRGQQ